MKTAQLLLVEDDVSLGFIIKDNLEIKGYKVDLFEDGEKGWRAFQGKAYDLCILDVMLPKKDGFELLENIRSRNMEVPVLFLTARNAKEDKIEGFRKGGDDYILKPFNIEELLYRVEVFLRRAKATAPQPREFEIGNSIFSFTNLTLTQKGKPAIQLTQKEADLLKLFCSNRGRLLKREEILRSVWGDDDYFLGKSLDVFISKLRKYLKEDPAIEIVNQFGVGFRLVVNGE